MHEQVRQSVDKGDVKTLKYIFVDCLDVDPTFDEYREDYDYCKKNGAFESHKDLTPLTNRQSDWNEDYWIALKGDLRENFSRERLEHMVKVAQVFYSDKIARLKRDRLQQPTPPREKISTPQQSQPQIQIVQPSGTKSRAELQAEEIARARQQLAEENAAIEATQQRQQQQIENARIQNQTQKKTSPNKNQASNIVPILLIIAVVLGILFVVIPD